jgi:hypothetical protein
LPELTGTIMTTANTHRFFTLNRPAGRSGVMRLIGGVALYCLIFSSVPSQLAQADSYSGNDFKKDCIQYDHMQKMTSDFSARAAGYCLGYFSAVLENSTGFCLPQDVKKRDIHKKMAQFLTNATELLDLDAAAVILSGLKETFPCRPSSNGK